MENRIVIRSLRRQLDQVIVHEQVEKGIAINKNLSANQINQQFITPRKVSQSKQRHPWIEERLASHKMPQAASIISHEVQTSEAQRRTNNLQQNSKR